jgi:MFS transporter, DHA2 family, multidrug resistance protein
MAATHPPRRWLSTSVLCLALLVVGLDTTVLNVAIPTLATALSATTTELQWFVDSYLLVLATLLLPAGLAGDRFGRKPMTIVALVVFGVGSLWCAFVGSATALIAGRAVMGIGAALLTPLTFSWIIALFGEDERAKALGVVGAASFLGMPLGPIVAGWLLHHYTWGSVFLINVPVIAAAVVLGMALLPGGGRGQVEHVDWLGAGLSVVGLAAFTYGMIQAPVEGWADPLVLTAMLGGMSVLVAFVVWERYVRHPLLDTRLWSLSAFRWGSAAVTTATLLGMVALFSVPIYLQGVLGVDALGSGLRLLPLLGGIVVGIIIGVGTASRLGGKAAILSGFGLLALGAGLATQTYANSAYGWVATWLVVLGAGFGCALISGQTLALETLTPQRAGVGGAVVQVLRHAGSVVGIAVLVSILNTVYRSRVETDALPAASSDLVKGSVQGGLSVAASLGDPRLADSVRDAFLDGMRAQMVVTALVALLGLAVTLVAMPRRYEQVSVPA